MFGDNDYEEWSDFLQEYSPPPYNLPGKSISKSIFKLVVFYIIYLITTNQPLFQNVKNMAFVLSSHWLAKKKNPEGVEFLVTVDRVHFPAKPCVI